MKFGSSRFLSVALVSLLVAGVVLGILVAWLRRDRLPDVVRVATGDTHGQYHQLWLAIKPQLEAELGRDVGLISTTGSIANRKLLESGDVDLAMMQGNRFTQDGASDVTLSIIAPAYPEPILVIAPRGTPIDSVRDLQDRKVFSGPGDSGSHASAMQLFGHFHVQVDEPEGVNTSDGFLAPLQSGAVEAAVITSGTENPDVKTLLDSGKFDLVSIPEASGLAARSVEWQPFEIESGFFSGSPTTPRTQVQTMATASLIVARDDVSNQLIYALLRVLYEQRLQTKFPNMLSRDDALSWSPLEPHPISRGYFKPVDRLSSIVTIMESFVATKEILFALGAGMFLLWRRAERLKKREREAVLEAEKDRLDVFMRQTLEIEKRQMASADADDLKQMLDEVTAIKLKALRELTDEELFADQAFSIFLLQCSNLISKIQHKIQQSAIETTFRGSENEVS